MRYSKQILIFVVSILTLVSCSKTPSDGESLDLVTYDLAFEVRDRAKLSPEKRALYDKIQARQPVSFKQITTLLVKDQADLYKGISETDLQKFLNNTLKGAEAELLENFKPSYEKNLPPLLYNRDANTLGHIAKETRLQCLSASTLFHVLSRQAWWTPRVFRERNLVLLYEPGHILPGYVKQGTLFGVEATAEGKAQFDYGPTRELSTESLRVVDAELYSIVELFKEHLKDPARVADEVLRRTARRYEIPLVPIRTVPSGFGEAVAVFSPFAFGSIEMPVGDLTRGRFTAASRRDAGRFPLHFGLGARGVVAPLMVPGKRPASVWVPEMMKGIERYQMTYLEKDLPFSVPKEIVKSSRLFKPFIDSLVTGIQAERGHVYFGHDKDLAENGDLRSSTGTLAVDLASYFFVRRNFALGKMRGDMVQTLSSEAGPLSAEDPLVAAVCRRHPVLVLHNQDTQALRRISTEVARVNESIGGSRERAITIVHHFFSPGSLPTVTFRVTDDRAFATLQTELARYLGMHAWFTTESTQRILGAPGPSR